MTKYIGRKVDVGIGRESVRGTAVAPTYWIPKIDFTFDEKVTKVRSAAGIGTIQDSEEAFVVEKWGEGEMSGEVRDKSFGLILLSLLGGISTAGPTDSAYTHSFSIQDDAQHDSVTLTVVDPNSTERYALVMVSSLELTQALDDTLKFRCTFMGKTSKQASASPTYTTDYKFTKSELTFKLAANLAALGAASSISLKSLDLSINANVVMDNVLGSAEPEDFLNQQFSIEGSFSLNYEDETYKEYMRQNTSRAMEMTWTSTRDTIGAATRPSLSLKFPKVDFFDWEPDNSLDVIVPQSISFKCNQDLTGGEDMISTCQLINTVSSYT